MNIPKQINTPLDQTSSAMI